MLIAEAHRGLLCSNSLLKELDLAPHRDFARDRRSASVRSPMTTSARNTSSSDVTASTAVEAPDISLRKVAGHFDKATPLFFTQVRDVQISEEKAVASADLLPISSAPISPSDHALRSQFPNRLQLCHRP